MGVKISICEFLKDLLGQDLQQLGSGMGDGNITRKGELQKVVLENVVTPLIDFLEYGIDDKPKANTEEAAAEGADLKNVEENKSKESPESASPGP